MFYVPIGKEVHIRIHTREVGRLVPVARPLPFPLIQLFFQLPDFVLKYSFAMVIRVRNSVPRSPIDERLDLLQT